MMAAMPLEQAKHSMHNEHQFNALCIVSSVFPSQISSLVFVFLPPSLLVALSPITKKMLLSKVVHL